MGGFDIDCNYQKTAEENFHILSGTC